jgi:hypothetical protein
MLSIVESALLMLLKEGTKERLAVRTYLVD